MTHHLHLHVPNQLTMIGMVGGVVFAPLAVIAVLFTIAKAMLGF